MKKFLPGLLITLFLSVFISSAAFAQPTNNECAGATSLGTLASPGGACSGGFFHGTPTTIATTSVGSSGANPYTYIAGCSGGTAPAPAKDVWYSFVASGYTVNITVSGGTLGAAYIALYEGTCGNLQGRGCVVGAGATTSLQIGQIVVGQTYYIQISGATSTAEGTFNLSVENDNDCNPCLIQSHITASPMPVNGAYEPGQTVDFCFTVDLWDIVATNWIHGVQIAYGNGYSGISNQVAAASCDGGGVWKWTNGSVTGNSGITFGAGWYYDRDNDNQFSDNYGDNCEGAGKTWTFCFRLTVAAACNPGSDLSVTINTTGDGESGNWSSVACNDDLPTKFFAVGSCCPPNMSSTPSCPAPDPLTGSVTATPVGAQGPYTYSWTNGTTGISTTTGVAGANTVSNLAPGTYTVYVTDKNNCRVDNTVTIASNPVPTVGASNNGPICNGASVTLTGSGASTYSWNTGATSVTTSESPTSTTTYTVIGTNASGCTDDATTTVTVNNVPTATLLGGGSICNGSATPLTVNLGGTGPWNLVYNDGTTNQTVNNIATSPYIINASTAGNYTLVSVANAQCSGTANGSAVVIVNTSPTAAISGGGTICADGSTTTISVALTGTGPWIIKYTDGTNITTVPVVNTSPYTFTTSTAGTYTLTDVSDANCTGTVSGSATVIVNPIPTVNTVSDVTYCNNETATAISFTGAVAGTTFNWVNDNTAIGIGASGAGNIASFTATNTGTSPISAIITVTPTAAGCTGTPITFTIIVNPIPTVNATVDETVCNGSAISAISFSGNIGTTTYNWVNTNTSIGLAANGTGNISTFNGTNTGSTSINGSITVTPTVNGCTGTPDVFVLTVNPTPSVNNIPNATYCNGDGGAAINFTGAITSTNYSWTNDNSTIGIGASGVGNIGAFTATNSGITSVTSNFTVTPEASSCIGTPKNFTITVDPTPTVNAIGDQTVCNNINFTAINPSGNVAGTVYNWANTNTAIGLAASGNGNIAAFAGTNTGVAGISGTVTVTPDFNGCIGTPETFTLTVNPIPVVDPITNQTYCNTDNVSTTNVTSPVIGTSFAWVNSDPSIGLAANGSGNISAYTATNTGSNSITSTITLTPSANGCTGPANSFTVTVNPTPLADLVTDASFCNGENSPATTLSGNVSGLTIDWTNDDPSIGLAASGTGNIPSFNATNTGTTTITATITLSPTANGCNGPNETFNIVVYPTPDIDPVPNDVTYCNGELTMLEVITGSVAGSTFDWTNNNTLVGLAANGTGNVPSFTAINNGSTPVIATVTLTPTANGCPGASASFNYTIDPTPVVNSLNDLQYCNGDATSLVSISSTPSGATLAWTNSNTTIGLGASGSGNISSFNATNASSVVITSTITITPTLNGCTGPDSSFTITVSPSPVMNNVPNQQYCNGNTTSQIVLSATPAGSTFNWTNSNPAITGALGATGTGNINSYVATNTGTTAQQTTFTVTPTLNGCVGADETFTVTVNPQPTANAGTNQDICIGDTAVLNGNGAATCAWSPVPGGGNTCSTFANPLTTTTYTLIVTDANGCADTSDVEVIVHDMPVADFSANSICLGGTTQFTDLSTAPAGESFISYLWTLDSGATDANVNPSYIYNTCGMKQVDLTVTTNFGCSNTINKPIYVYCLPTASFTVLDDTLCTSESAFFTNTTSSAVAFSSSWTFGTGQGTSTSTDPSYLYNGSGMFNVGLIVTTTEGCSDTAISQNINVFNSPSPNFTANKVCLNNPTLFTNTTQANGNSGLSYVWDFADGSLDVNQDPTHTYSTYGLYNVNLSVASSEGCTNDTTIVVEVFPVPLADFSSTAVCYGLPTTFTVTNSIATSSYSWDFQANGSNDATGNPASFICPHEGVDSTRLVVTNSNGCTDTIVKPFTVNSLPDAGFTADVLNGCEPLEVNFTDTTNIPGSTVVSWTWDLGDGNSGNSSNVSNTYSAGTYDIQLVVVTNFGCTDTIRKNGYIESYPNPDANFSYDPETIQESKSFVFFNDMSVGNVTTWHWYFGDTSETSISTIQNPLHVYGDTGTYCVDLHIKTDKGCTDSITKCLEVLPEFIIYIPNAFTPNADGANEKFFPKGRGFLTDDGYELLIFDRWGNLIFRSDRYSITWDGKHQQSGAECQIDTYVYRLNVKDIFEKKHQFTGQVHLVR